MQAYRASQTLPVEVWSRIFQLSCTDDGYTGHSLSQVSRTFHVVSAPYRFQSVSLRNLKFVLRFYQVLKEKQPHLRRVRYLCIAHDGDLLGAAYGVHSNWDRERCFSFAHYEQDTSGEYGPDSGEEDKDSPSPEREPFSSDSEEEDVEDVSLTDAEMMELKEEVDFIKSPEGKEYLPEGCSIQGCIFPAGEEGKRYFDSVFIDTIHSIFELCSNTLWILSVSIDGVISIGHDTPFLPEVSMPCLRELTWGTPITSSWVLFGPSPPKPQQAHFPALERLHFLAHHRNSYRDSHITQHSSQFIMQHCPKLQYIRSRSGPGTLEDAFIKAQSTGQPISLYTPPTVIEHLVDLHYDWTNRSAPRWFSEGRLNEADVRVKLAVLRKRDAKSAEEDWLERISGELGGWKWAASWFKGEDRPLDWEKRIQDAARDDTIDSDDIWYYGI